MSQNIDAGMYVETVRQQRNDALDALAYLKAEHAQVVADLSRRLDELLSAPDEHLTHNGGAAE